jgi:hypothetical protein
MTGLQASVDFPADKSIIITRSAWSPFRAAATRIRVRHRKRMVGPWREDSVGSTTIASNRAVLATDSKSKKIIIAENRPGTTGQGDTYARQGLGEARRGDQQARGEDQGFRIANGRSGGGEESHVEHDLDQLSQS